MNNVAKSVASFLMVCSTDALADDFWVPKESDWQFGVESEILATFGVQAFDAFIWADQTTLWAIRPSLGIQQNLLANTVWQHCKGGPAC